MRLRTRKVSNRKATGKYFPDFRMIAFTPSPEGKTMTSLIAGTRDNSEPNLSMDKILPRGYLGEC